MSTPEQREANLRRMAHRYATEPEFKTRSLARSTAWKKANRDRVNAAHRARYAADAEYRESFRVSREKYEAANPGKRCAIAKQRFACDPAFRAYKAGHCAKRNAVKLRAIPAWADLDAIAEVYQEATYHQLHVDHIVPLQSKRVCGLHVWDNLQLITPSENFAKSNRSWPDM